MPPKRNLPQEFVDIDAKRNKFSSNDLTDPRKEKFEVKCEEEMLTHNIKQEAIASEGIYFSVVSSQ